MAGVTVRGARNQPANFDILQDDNLLLDQRYPPISTQAASDHGSGALEELPVDCQARSLVHPHALSKSQGTSALKGTYPLAKVPSPGSRRRPAVSTQTFEPLEETREEPSSFSETKGGTCLAMGHSMSPQTQTSRSLSAHTAEKDPFATAQFNTSIDYIVKQQLAGQYEWVMTYPTPARSLQKHHLKTASHFMIGGPKESVTFGCNLLARNTRSASSEEHEVDENANSYTFIATPLEKEDAMFISASKGPQDIEFQANMAMTEPKTAVEAPLKPPEVIEPVEQAVSPSLTQVSERSGSFMDQSSRAGSFSIPRIEDSFEELDRLEDELEAVSAVTNSRRVEQGNADQGDVAPSENNKPASTKRVTIASGQSATVRVKPSQKTRPALRRSNSLTQREKQTEEEDFVPEQKAANISISRAKSTSTRPTGSRTPVKSTKPLTVPKFELPGEAVSQRLKEQREARKAQQAEAQKAYVAPTRPKSSKPLTKPTFELPGEAISRRKREEKEAKLKTQEEEERKRREFKARPIKHNTAPSSLPRETIASRARQGKSGLEESTRGQDTNRTKRLAASSSLNRLGPTSSAVANSPQGRGRNSEALPSDDASRATSVSTSVSEKRSSVSLEEVAQQRARGKEIFTRDNSYSRDREKEKRDREAATRLAREQAAERSRAASREWAEKQRQKQQAHMEAARQKGQARAQ